jgi:hypothetical protein
MHSEKSADPENEVWKRLRDEHGWCAACAVGESVKHLCPSCVEKLGTHPVSEQARFLRRPELLVLDDMGVQSAEG